MISYLKGILKYIFQDTIIIEVNNIGYQIFVSSHTLTQLPKEGNIIEIYTHMNVREDNISLFGFLTINELDCFNMLINVSGIGPKVALGILSTLRPQDINKAIIIEDINLLTKAPGIGKKTAQRIILELKDKLKINSTFNYDDNLEQYYEASSNSVNQEAIEALIALGYSQIDATNSVINVYNENLKLEELIKLSLKRLSKI